MRTELVQYRTAQRRPAAGFTNASQVIFFCSTITPPASKETCRIEWGWNSVEYTNDMYITNLGRNSKGIYAC